MAVAHRTSPQPFFGGRRRASCSRFALAWALISPLACQRPAPSEAGEVGKAEPVAPAPPLDDGEARDAAAPQAADLLPTPNDEAAKVRAAQAAGSGIGQGRVDQLEAWAAERKAHAHVALFDLESRTWLLEHRADEPTNPASTQKLLTAAAALELLGGAHVFRTEVLGRLDGGSIERLVLRGGGAPDLETRDWLRVAHALRERGVQRVGSVVVDASRFTEAWVPPAFEQQPGEWAAFRAPISALALDRNSVTLHVLPGAEGEPARTWFEPPGAVRVTGQVTTSAPRSPERVTWSLAPEAQRVELSARLGGSLAAGAPEARYSRRLDDPRLVPGLAMRELLREQGIRVGDDVSLGSADGAPRLLYLDSQPLASIVRALGKDSDNFTAEMLAVALSQSDERGRSNEPWSTKRGLAVLARWMKEHGLDAPGVVLENGSGLFDANRVTARVLVRVLDYMFDRPGSSAEFMAQLARGGRDGTLRNRFVRGPLAGRVRAKTGTLRDTSALAGYVLRADGRRPLAFAVVLSGARGRLEEARRRIDETLEGLVAQSGP